MALSERLCPWLEVVKLHATPVATAESGYTLGLATGARNVWVVWKSLDSRPASVQLAWQGLDLLALLAIVDVDEWRRAVRITWPEDVVARAWVEELPPHTEVTLGIIDKGRDIAWYNDLATHAGEHWDSIAYSVVRTELEGMLKDGRKPSGIAPIRFELDVSVFFEERRITTLLIGLLQIAMNDHFERCLKPHAFASGRRWCPIFRVAEIDCQRLHNLENHMPILQQLAAHGVYLSHLSIQDLAVQEATVPSFAAKASTLFAAVRSLEVHDSASAETVDGIFSLLVQNDSVRSISIMGVSEFAEVRLWRWIFALCFGRSALLSLEKLILDCPVNPPADFNEVAEGFVDVSDATAAMFPIEVPSSAAGVRPEGIVLVSALKFRLTAPTPEQQDASAEREQGIVLRESLTDLRVLDDMGNWTAVVVPGWGRAFVHRKDILDRRRVLPVRTQPAQPRLLTHLVLNDVSSSEFVLSLVRVVGAFIKNLSITGTFDPLKR